MARFRWLLICLSVSLLASPFLAADPAEGEDEEGTVEEEGDAQPTEGQATEQAVVPPSTKDLDEEEEVKPIGPSPDADVYMLFTEPPEPKELPAGGTVRMLIGLYNKAKESFYVETIDAAFHYPMDHSFHIRNFTHSPVNRLVEPGVEATFAYGILPSEDLAGRPFGLRVNVNYRDLNGNKFANAVFNETIQIVEDESGASAETIFLYVLIGCLAVLLLLLGQQLLQKMRKKAGMTKKKEPVVEMGTTGNTDIDWEWIPKEVLNHAQKSPRVTGSPRKSPRQRAGKAGKKNRGDSGGDSDAGYDS